MPGLAWHILLIFSQKSFFCGVEGQQRPAHPAKSGTRSTNHSESRSNPSYNPTWLRSGETSRNKRRGSNPLHTPPRRCSSLASRVVASSLYRSHPLGPSRLSFTGGVPNAGRTCDSFLSMTPASFCVIGRPSIST